MSITITIPSKIITFTKEERDKWVKGEREDCISTYCRKLSGTYGFGEYVVGKHFESQGYLWIHHDYDVIGVNKPGKYPEAEMVLQNILGMEAFEKTRFIHQVVKPLRIEEPDLLIYKPDFSELKFVEVKRKDTRDKLRDAQLRGLALLTLLLGCKVEIYEVAEYDKHHSSSPFFIWEFH